MLLNVQIYSFEANTRLSHSREAKYIYSLVKYRYMLYAICQIFVHRLCLLIQFDKFKDVDGIEIHLCREQNE